MTNPRSIVSYKDGEGAPTRYFGPFVSDSIADFFRATLPMPLKGGWCKRHPLQQFTANDGHLVAEQILRDRSRAA